MKRAPALALAAALTCSCGRSLMTLPQGAGIPASDARDALGEATSACHQLKSISAEIAVSGSINGQRVRATLNVGLMAPDVARVEAFALSQLVFTFVSRGSDSTLVLQQEQKVLEHGPPGAVLEAVTGVPVDPETLRLLVTGCTQVADATEARALGDDWRVVPDGGDEVYLHRSPRQAPWQLVAAVRRDARGNRWRVEYRKFVNGLPSDIQIASIESDRFNLHLTLSEVLRNDTLDARVFQVQIPASAAPTTLEELRREGPLSGPAGR